LFYRVISEDCGEKIDDDLSLMRYLRALSATRKRCEKVEKALAEAEENGYGIVMPTEEEYVLQKPKLVKKSAGYCAEFRANATSYHVLKVPVAGSVAPIVGTKEQGEEFISGAVDAYQKGEVWDTNILGKSLRELVLAELSGKGEALPKELRAKLLRITTRAVNDGKSNLFCILF
jgi:stage IV sporulation protein A